VYDVPSWSCAFSTLSEGKERRVVRGQTGREDSWRGWAGTSLTSSCTGIKRGLLELAPKRWVLGSALAAQHTALPSARAVKSREARREGELPFQDLLSGFLFPQTE